MHVKPLILSLTLGGWGGDHVLRLVWAAYAKTALAAPQGTVTTKMVHQLPQPGRVCQSPLPHLYCIATFRSQPCVFP